jgi:hypothetical protein
VKSFRSGKIGLLLLAAALSSAPFIWEYSKKAGIFSAEISPESTNVTSSEKKERIQLPQPEYNYETPDTTNFEEPIFSDNQIQNDQQYYPKDQDIFVANDLKSSSKEEPEVSTESEREEIIRPIYQENSVKSESNEESPKIQNKEDKENKYTGENKKETSFLGLIKLDIPNELNYNERGILKTTLQFVNSSSESFSGKLTVTSPQGLRSITGEEVPVSIAGNDTLFLPLAWLGADVRNSGEAGEINYTLKDLNDNEVSSESTRIGFKERINLQMTLDHPVITVFQLKDSLTLSARVHNRGNTDKFVTVVMSMQMQNAERRFFELKGMVASGTDQLFELKIWPNQEMFSAGNLPVYISGMYGTEKQVFGNAVITLQSIISSRRFVDNSIGNSGFFDNQQIPQDITLSYRNLGGMSIFQAMGGGHVNLPSGNMSLQGLIYAAENQNELVGLNTRLRYQADNKSITLGNINEQLEYSIIGRGVKATYSDKNRSNILKVGLVDNQFNLFSKTGLFQHGYSFFIKDEIGKPLADSRLGVSYLLREDNWESAKHNMAGADWNWKKGNSWRVLLKSYGAVSDYYLQHKNVVSGAMEMQYSGTTENGLGLSGNYYYSTNYFPGNRRGMTSLQQSVNKNISKSGILTASAFYMKVAPRSYQYNIAMETENARLDLDYYNSKKKNLGVGVGYQRHYEYGNYNYLGIADDENEGKRAVTNAHRLVEYVNWSSLNSRYSIHASLENGVVQYVYQKTWSPQFRVNTNVSLGWFSVNGSYQYGGFFLSEQKFADLQNKITQRLLLNVSFNKNLWSNKLELNGGGNYNKDLTMGTTNSAFVNLNYKPKSNYAVFLNQMVYRYEYLYNTLVNTYNTTLYNIEGGVRISLNQARPDVGKKSKISGFAFYDTNGNNLWDADEKPATDYLMLLDGKAFITDETGGFVYSSVPFGTYKIQSGARSGWFNKEISFNVSTFKSRIEIPLHQAGTVKGNITYEYNKKTAVDFVPKYSGISFRITARGEEIQRIVTNNDGDFLVFLPNGSYYIELLTSGLDRNLIWKNPVQEFNVESGKITTLEPFVLQVKNKTVNIRKFEQ